MFDEKGFLRMKLKKIVATLPVVALGVVFCYLVLDERAALFVKKLWRYNKQFSLFSLNIPDMLFSLVCLITVSAWIVFFYLTRKGMNNTHTRFFQLIAISVPLAHMVKWLFKYAFGRISTRFWLLYPRSHEFHWLHGTGNFTGFPSGHMAVFTALVAALWVYYPRHRTVYLFSLAALALALIVTNYHFISDIIAGAYTGLFVHAATDASLTYLRRSQEKNHPI